MKILFTEDPIGRPQYKKGMTAEFNGPVEESYGKKYVERGWARDITERSAPRQAAASRPEPPKPPVDHTATIEDRGKVEIPENWAELPAAELRAIADAVSDNPTKNKGEASEAIEAELKRRADAAK